MDVPSNLLGLAVLYICVLFAIAWFVDSRVGAAQSRPSERRRAFVYALAITVYCSSWTFYGAVGSATASPWSHAPIYLGPILVYLLAWPLVRRVINIGIHHRVTSIADYIGARFGKRQNLAVLVTVVAAAAVLPYIALQFRAVNQAWLIIGGNSPTDGGSFLDSSIVIVAVLTVFTILFGARRLDMRERHQGMMSAVAVESLVKLFAFLCVALLALAYLRRPDIASTVDWGSQSIAQTDFSADFLTRTIISACAILCLPRQFHTTVVEAQEGSHTATARWLVPLYLLLFMLLVVPVSLAGAQLFNADPAHASPDTYVQLMPAALDQSWIALIAFIGGISAATGMVIVATVSLAIMLTNEVVVPAMIRALSEERTALLALGDRLRLVRQVTIALILVAAYFVSRQLHSIAWLSEIGFMSFLAAAQIAPGLLAGIFWRRAHGLAVTAGLAMGIALWFYCLVLPATLSPGSSLLVDGPFALTWLRPQALFGWEGPGPLSYAAAWSLGANVLVLAALSYLLKPSVADQRQADVFMGNLHREDYEPVDDLELSGLRAGQLRALIPPFVGEDHSAAFWRNIENRYQQRLLPADRVPMFAVREAEALIAGVIGATSAHQVINEMAEHQRLDVSGLAALVAGADRQNSFNRELVEAAIESMQHGVSVVDSEQRLVAWNSRYERMFSYPERMLYVGIPIAKLYRYNAERGVMGKGADIESEIEKRLSWLRKGHPHQLERQLPDGRYIDIHGVPLPKGGFLTTYIDITEHREVLAQLRETQEELESRLASGTQSLSETNAELRRENRLRAEAENELREVNLSKSRFMSATSHDLLQPINAARLLLAALPESSSVESGSAETVGKVDKALQRAEGLIEELREIARLDSGAEKAELSNFALDPLLAELGAEFAPLAKAKGLTLHVRPSSVHLYTDRRLLARLLQNLLGNAIKYSHTGKVTIGARRREGSVELQVLDQGVGIQQADQERVFREFERLTGGHGGDEDGLGLGLAIVSRYAKLLEAPLKLSSIPGVGSRFSVIVARGDAAQSVATAARDDTSDGRLEGVRVLCIENDARVRDALEVMLCAQGCVAEVVVERGAFRERLEAMRPHVIIADYHLDDGDTGVEAVSWAQSELGVSVPCVVASADISDEVREASKRAGYRTLPKPINPARLVALIRALADTSDELPTRQSPSAAHQTG